ncbi:phosphomannomutase [Aliiroseovarius sp. PrR006]|uniref:phosphomannomutase n=1 Tax=Aliiroseovarius sp. PrR006 TaxID=2706883 RepID=UPI0013D66AB2|nr:phosphomannomutase [Aliiroseovarius sp. PrR006]NDW54616.1 phosphomannomutase [Aliiroseovarius sp. PrR006]
MAPKFGTSGLRGLVTELTENLVQDYTRAFLEACPHGGALFLGRDLRPSSPAISATVAAAAQAQGVSVFDCGALPTPALALAALKAGNAAIMITGSHIPSNRNGLKFYVPSGEISKEDEQSIQANLGRGSLGLAAPITNNDTARMQYVARYINGFGSGALTGFRIGVYQHSSVARDIMCEVVSALGGEAVTLARSNTFIPVDTEALDPKTRAMLAGWCAEHDLDAVISTDGDADRPMVADADGVVVPGDLLGMLTAQILNAQIICTPVSSNSGVQEMDGFAAVNLTRIGSPYVIAAMDDALKADPAARVVGYEANGGFLLGFPAIGPTGQTLAPLMTRDCLLPMLAPLAAARAEGITLSELVSTLPTRFTAGDRLTEVSTQLSQNFLAELIQSSQARASFFRDLGAESSIDTTDGLRMSFERNLVVHFRPSGNAPEFRCYAEAPTSTQAQELVAHSLEKVRQRLG